MIRPLTLCVLFAVTTLCHGDDGATQFDKVSQPANSPVSSAHVGAFADASPAELQQLAKINEATRKVLFKHLSKEFRKYEMRIAQLEDQLAEQSNSNPQPRYATPIPVDSLARAAHTAPLPYAPSPTQSSAASPRPQPNTPTKTWQRVNLNGQWFYIVPAEHADAFVPPQPQ